MRHSIRPRKSILKDYKLSDVESLRNIKLQEGFGFLPIAKIRAKKETKDNKKNSITILTDFTPSTSSSTDDFIRNLSITYFKQDTSSRGSLIDGSSSIYTLTDIENLAESSGDEQLLPKLFRSLPKLSEISDLSASTDEETTPMKIRDQERNSTDGYFTEPIDSNISLKHPIEEDILPPYDIECNEESFDGISAEDSLQNFSTSDESVTQVQQDKIDLKDALEQELLNQLIQENVQHAEEMEEKSLFDQVTADSVELFLINIINEVVNKCENIGRKAQRSLDKRKMMKELIKLSNEYKLLKDINVYLNHCVVEKYKKSRVYYPIVPSKYDHQYEDRYKEALNLMDFTIQRRNDVVDICRANVECLQLEEQAAREEVENSENQLGEFIKETLLQRQEFGNMKHIVTDQLRRMAAVRNEITDVRSQLLIKQHEVEVLKDKLEQIKYITNDLTVHEYLNVQAVVQSLSQKNEECRAEVDRLSIKSKRDIIWLAHIRYKNQMLNGNLQSARNLLDEKRKEETTIHRSLFYATLEHENLKKQIREVKYEGGLLHYPALLRDYNNMDISINEKSARVDDLIMKHDYLIWRIRKLMLKHSIEDPEMSRYPSLRNSRLSRLSKFSRLSSQAETFGFNESFRKRPAILKGITSSSSPSPVPKRLGILKRRKTPTKNKKQLIFSQL